ncbi:hypothetical protein WNY58_16615 [Neptuniibacter pectenicola]|uniref:Uncharacterized protein n=1 Tax=Neptuniibacter pectenicola TaxID=1806669 RepID=A0ABU9TWA9_9GAMM
MNEHRKLLKRLKEIDSSLMLLNGETFLQINRDTAELRLNNEQHLRKNALFVNCY